MRRNDHVRTLPSRLSHPRTSRRDRLRLSLEQLEQRHLLAGDPWLWFESFDDVPRMEPSELAAERSGPDSQAIGPHDLVASEWIVQLTDAATRSVRALDSLGSRFEQQPVEFTVISGLGSPGLVLMRGRGVTDADVQIALSTSDDVASFSANAIIEGQAAPNDPEYVGGLMPGLDRLSMSAAWDDSIGSMSVVVGVVDGGIDATHPDLFLNIWLNQGEIPDALGAVLEDTEERFKEPMIEWARLLQAPSPNIRRVAVDIEVRPSVANRMPIADEAVDSIITVAFA